MSSLFLRTALLIRQLNSVRCPRCELSYEKEKDKCPHCSNMSDAEVEDLLAKSEVD